MNKSFDWDEIECPNRISQFRLSSSSTSNVSNNSEFFERKHETHENNGCEPRPEEERKHETHEDNGCESRPEEEEERKHETHEDNGCESRPEEEEERKHETHEDNDCESRPEEEQNHDPHEDNGCESRPDEEEDRKHETDEKNGCESRPEEEAEELNSNKNVETEPDFEVKKEDSEILETIKLEDEENDYKPKILSNLLQESWNVKVEKVYNVNKKPGNSKSVHPPSVYNYVEIYDKKKQHYRKELLKQEQEERKKRLFQSRPAPNFALMQNKSLKKKLEITMPNTPEVLKRSQELNEIRKQKEESDKQKNDKTKFKARRNPFK